MRYVLLLVWVGFLSAASARAVGTIDTSGARPLDLKKITITSSAGTEFLIDRLRLFPDVCSDERGDLLFVSGVRGVYHFTVHNGTVVQDTTARYEPFISYHTMPYEADGIVPTEYIDPDNSLLSCTSSDEVPFSRFTGSVCDIVGTDEFSSADVNNDGLEDLIYGTFNDTDRYRIAVGGRLNSLQCDSITRVPVIPSKRIVCHVVDRSTLYVVSQDSSPSKPGVVTYSRIQFDWNGALGQRGQEELIDSLVAPFDSAIARNLGSVYDHKERKGYIWIHWSSPSNRHQTVVYHFQGDGRLTQLRSIDGVLDGLEEVKGVTGYYAPIMKFSIVEQNRLYVARIDELDKPFAYITDSFGALIHAALASDQDGDAHPDLIIWRNMGDTLLQYASVYYEYNRIDRPTSVPTPPSSNAATVVMMDDAIVTRGIDGPYSVEMYSLLGAPVAPTLQLRGDARTQLTPLVSGLPTQLIYVIVRSTNKHWTVGYWK